MTNFDAGPFLSALYRIEAKEERIRHENTKTELEEISEELREAKDGIENEVITQLKAAQDQLIAKDQVIDDKHREMVDMERIQGKLVEELARVQEKLDNQIAEEEKRKRKKEVKKSRKDRIGSEVAESIADSSVGMRNRSFSSEAKNSDGGGSEIAPPVQRS